jgi:hypothetical protein
MKKNYFVVFALAALVAIAPTARADQFSFSFNGGGISSSGILTVSPSSTQGVYEITGISGSFSDTNVGVSGAISGLYQPVSYVSDTLGTPGVAFTSGGLSYDDLFYPAGDSPAICYELVNGIPTLTYPFSGGQFDIFGVAFDIAGAGGYVAELWSNGDVGNGPIVYAAGLANATGIVDNPNAVPGPGVPPPGRYGSLTTSAVPEPHSLFSLGIGLIALVCLAARRGLAARKTSM